MDDDYIENVTTEPSIIDETTQFDSEGSGEGREYTYPSEQKTTEQSSQISEDDKTESVTENIPASTDNGMNRTFMNTISCCFMIQLRSIW